MRLKPSIILLRITALVALFHTLLLSAVAQQIYPIWQIGYHNTESEQPEHWLESTVPGAVQLDVMKAENYEQPWWYGNNVAQFDWMEDVWFTYKTIFERPELKDGERLFFFSKGIDYHFKVVLNGKIIRDQEGMFTYVDVDLTDDLRDVNELRVVLRPVPKLGFEVSPETPDSYRRNARESVKPAVSYGWDWHPRCVTRGIWDETYLAVRQPVRLNDVSMTYVLNDDLTHAKVTAEISGVKLSGSAYEWTIKDPEGRTVLQKTGAISSDNLFIPADLASPKLWQPNGYGDPNLYVSEFLLLDTNNCELERRIIRTGFRRVRLVVNEKSWNDSWGFPATSAMPPASLEVNNRRIFGKGSNWVHPEVFIGTITPERYREQLVLAKNANFNLLRVWGGGIVNKEAFYDICDELGLLVWQDFPLANNVYTDKPSYLKVLKQEAASIVNRLKKHACLALWSGGNELYWGGMTEQSLPFRLLNSVCYQLDPNTPFINTSPFYGVGHGHYLFYDKESGREVFQWMTEARMTAYTEFGVPSISNLEVLKSFIPSDELFPPKEGTTWSVHHGFGAWRNSSWTEMATFRKYFGDPHTVTELVQYSQLLQGEGLKFIYEEARRQKPYCSMALNWCFQEPWPTAANNSIVNWPNEPKPAFKDVTDACRPILASARVRKFVWKENEDFEFDLFLLNDSYNQVEKLEIAVTLEYDNQEMELLTWDCPGAEPFTNAQGPTMHFSVPHLKSNLFTLWVKVAGHPEYDSAYQLLYKGEDVSKVLPDGTFAQGGETN